MSDSKEMLSLPQLNIPVAGCPGHCTKKPPGEKAEGHWVHENVVHWSNDHERIISFCLFNYRTNANSGDVCNH